MPSSSAEAVYQTLADEESREIFLWRRRYFETKNIVKLYNELVGPGPERLNRHNQRRMKNWLSRQGQAAASHDTFDFMESRRPWEHGVVLFGAGVFLQHYVFRLMMHCQIMIKAICDMNRHGGMFGIYPIVTVDEALALAGGAPFFLTTWIEANRHRMRQSLLERGVDGDLIFTPDFRYYIPLYTDKEQYFDPEVIQPGPDEVYIDAGCSDGRTILSFREFTGSLAYKRIYGFEPGAASFEKTNEAIGHNGLERVTLIKKGLWDAAAALPFNDNGHGSSSIAENGSVTIETVALDDAVDPGDRVTFIKMDIEGAELNALHGARGIITRDRPRLAVSVYHRPEDIADIPSYILSLNPEYRFYLRHYSPFSHLETVLFAI